MHGKLEADGTGRPDGKSWVKTRLTPHYIALVYDTCLKSFWRRKADLPGFFGPLITGE